MTPPNEMTGQETTAVAWRCCGCDRRLKWTEQVYRYWASSLQGWRLLCSDCAHPKKRAAIAKATGG